MCVKIFVSISLLFVSLHLFLVNGTAYADADSSILFSNSSTNAPTLSSSQGDAYHTWLSQELLAQHGLDGGEWLFFDEEQPFWRNATIATTEYERLSVENMPFTEALQVDVVTLPNAAWSDGVWVNLQTPVQMDDVVLLTFWIRSTAADIDGGMVGVVVEEEKTWRKSLDAFVLPNGTWQQIYLPFTINRADSAQAIHLAFHLGAQRQSIEIGGVAAVNYGQQIRIDDLPNTKLDSYVGREAWAGWRDAAADRIETHRKGDLTITVRDLFGRPIPNAQVSVEMQDHAFEWGTSVSTHQILSTTQRAITYREKLLDLDGKGHGFNLAVPENALKWKHWEQNNNYWVQSETAAAIQWLDQQGLKIHGHTAIWGNWAHMPDDLRVYDPLSVYADPQKAAYAAERMTDRVTYILTDTQLAAVDGWDILNEGRDATVLPTMFQDGMSEYANWFKTAVDTDPNKTYTINDFSIVAIGGMMVSSQETYKTMIDAILAEGGRIDGIGFQAHMNHPLTPPERVVAILDQFDEYDIPLRITEFDVRLQGNSPLMADYTRDFVTAIFSQPAVNSFTMWGYYDGIHWLGYSPMFSTDWELKPSGEQFVDLVFNQWWTNETGATNGQGIYRTRGFLGDYMINVTIEGENSSKSVPISLKREGTEMEIVLISAENAARFNHKFFLPYLRMP